MSQSREYEDNKKRLEENNLLIEANYKLLLEQQAEIKALKLKCEKLYKENVGKNSSLESHERYLKIGRTIGRAKASTFFNSEDAIEKYAERFANKKMKAREISYAEATSELQSLTATSVRQVKIHHIDLSSDNNESKNHQHMLGKFTK